MKRNLQKALDLIRIALGCACFALSFDLFLTPHGMNAGGLTGLSMVIGHAIGFGSVGIISAIINIPLFIIGGLKVGKRFFFSSLLGLLFLSVFIDWFSVIPYPQTEPLLAAIYGGVLCGFGLGLVFTSGGSTGGSDIIVRLLKLRWRYVPIGTINMFFDAFVAVLTGIVYADMTKALYSGISIFLCGQLVDLVVYRFDYSRVALIVSKKHRELARCIDEKLQRGATLLKAEGAYSQTETNVLLTAVKKHQVEDLKQLVSETDPEAFVIIQEAHQVLGDGFAKYSKDSL